MQSLYSATDSNAEIAYVTIEIAYARTETVYNSIEAAYKRL